MDYTEAREKLAAEAELLRSRNAVPDGCAKQETQGMAGVTDKPRKPSLLDRLEDQRYNLQRQLDRTETLINTLKKNPEFEAYHDFQELLRRDW